jgi:hypothetical protein
MPALTFDSEQIYAELQLLLSQIDDPMFSYWPARKQVARGIALAKTLVAILEWHCQTWDDSLPVGWEYGIRPPLTPDQQQLSQAHEILAQLEQRQTMLLEQHQHQQVLAAIHDYLNDPSHYFRSRRKLMLDSRPMLALPDELLVLTELEHLSLASCRLTNLAGIGQLTNLRHLIVSYNQLQRLPDDFAQLEQLEWLSLQNNQLSDVEVLFTMKCQRLTFLLLANNQLSEASKTRLRSHFAHVRRLEV